MTDAELDARLAKLSDEDLRAIVNDPLRNDLRRFSWLELYRRMASEILDLRAKLAPQDRRDLDYEGLQ